MKKKNNNNLNVAKRNITNATLHMCFVYRNAMF